MNNLYDDATITKFTEIIWP